MAYNEDPTIKEQIMTDTKFAQLKKTINHYTPELIMGAVTLTAIAAVVTIAKTTQVQVVPDFMLELDKFAVTRMLETGEMMRFETPKLNLTVRVLETLAN